MIWSLIFVLFGAMGSSHQWTLDLISLIRFWIRQSRVRWTPTIPMNFDNSDVQWITLASTPDLSKIGPLQHDGDDLSSPTIPRYFWVRGLAPNPRAEGALPPATPSQLIAELDPRQWGDWLQDRIPLRNMENSSTLIPYVGNLNFGWLCYYDGCGLYEHLRMLYLYVVS